MRETIMDKAKLRAVDDRDTSGWRPATAELTAMVAGAFTNAMNSPVHQQMERDRLRLQEEAEIKAITERVRHHKENGNFIAAAESTLELANRGVVSAQEDMGWFYQNGKGVQPNIDEAKKWYEKAAAAGGMRAHALLGDIAANNGDLAAAAKHYEVATASLDNPQVKANLEIVLKRIAALDSAVGPKRDDLAREGQVRHHTMQ